MEEIIKCQNIKKIYRVKKRNKVAVENLSFSLCKNEILGFIGVNGAGKSTTIKMLTGILLPTEGEIEVLGHNPYYERKKILKKIGVVFGQRSQLIWDLPAIDTFKLHGKIYELTNKEFKENMECIFSYLDVNEIMNIPVRQMSLGQRMCCEIVAALIHMPEILFLDEPTIGLDVFNKENIRNLVRKLKGNLGMSILLTSHDMEDIEQLSNRIIIVDKGKKLYEGIKHDLGNICGNIGKIVIDGKEKDFNIYPEWITKKERLFNQTVIDYKKDLIIPREVMCWLSDAFEDIKDFSISSVNLEETIKNIYKIEKRKNHY